MKLFFVTSNGGKVPSVQRVLAMYGVEVEQFAPEHDLVEVQAEDAAGVAVPKAFEAAKLLVAKYDNRPALMVIDSALHIPILHQFPGVYTKHVTGQIKLEGYLRLLSPFVSDGDRTCYFEDVIAYLAPNSEKPALFLRRDYAVIATTRRGKRRPTDKSPFVELFIPSGHTKTLAEMSDEELAAYRAQPKTEKFYHELASYATGKPRLI